MDVAGRDVESFDEEPLQTHEESPGVTRMKMSILMRGQLCLEALDEKTVCEGSSTCEMERCGVATFLLPGFLNSLAFVISSFLLNRFLSAEFR